MRQIAGKGEFLCRAVRAERFDENEEGSYNRHRRVLPVDGQPRWVKRENPPNLSGSGGFSYTFNTTIQIVTMNTQDRTFQSTRTWRKLVRQNGGAFYGYASSVLYIVLHSCHCVFFIRANLFEYEWNYPYRLIPEGSHRPLNPLDSSSDNKSRKGLIANAVFRQV